MKYTEIQAEIIKRYRVETYITPSGGGSPAERT